MTGDTNETNAQDVSKAVSWQEPAPLVQDTTRHDNAEQQQQQQGGTATHQAATTTNSSAPTLHATTTPQGAACTIKTKGDHMDLTTGATTTRCQSVRIVDAEEQQPTKHTWHERLTGRAAATTPPSSTPLSASFRGKDAATADSSIKQYRINSRMRDHPDLFDINSMKHRLWGHSSRSTDQNDGFLSYISTYLHWTFRASFLDVTLVSFVFFMMLISLFALCVFWIDRHQPECIVGVDRAEDEHLAFGDAWHLSWTTLSTVGYGVVAPGLPSTTDGSRCTVLNMLMAFESFVGVLFGGLTGAIIFAKVARIQSTAPVVFSDPIVVRYGSGCVQRAKDYNHAQVQEWDKETSESNHNEDDDTDMLEENPELPCPILEFRLVNTLWNQAGGEIMDATVNLVVSRLETVHDLDRRLAKKKSKKRKGKPRKLGNPSPSSKVSLLGGESRAAKIMAAGHFVQRLNQTAISSETDAARAAMPTPNDGNSSIADESSSTKPFNRAAAIAAKQAKERRELEQAMQEAVQKEVDHRMSQVAAAAAAASGTFPAGVRVSQVNAAGVALGGAASVAVDEGAGDEDVALAPRRIFHHLEVQTDSHPFFRRTWNIRHVCDEHSPLLPQRIRNRIAENHGFWPPELNSHDAVRKAINFHEILVSFSGTANVSGSSVYAQKVYEYVDMTVGYTFANVLTKDKDGKLIVDASLLNDVTEQRGGGAEPIRQKDAPIFAGYSNASRADGLAGALSSPTDTVATSGTMGSGGFEEEGHDEKKDADMEDVDLV